jgi:hypothetical protein
MYEKIHNESILVLRMKLAAERKCRPNCLNTGAIFSLGGAPRTLACALLLSVGIDGRDR